LIYKLVTKIVSIGLQIGP